MRARAPRSVRGLSSHQRICSGGKWRCEWCNVKEVGARGKGPGPGGPAALCSVCASRFRAGHMEPPQRDPTDNKFLCPGCSMKFETMYEDFDIRSDFLSFPPFFSLVFLFFSFFARFFAQFHERRYHRCHTVRCTPRRSVSRADWCTFGGVCPTPGIRRGLGSHSRGCSGGTWRCEWCNADEKAARGKSPGPNGPKTLCSRCGSRYRSGQGARVPRNAEGLYVCDRCTHTYDSTATSTFLFLGDGFLGDCFLRGREPPRPARAVGCTLRGAHTCWMLIGACDPML